MSASQAARHESFPGPVPFVISETDDGFQVYSPVNPREAFFVTGTPDFPACSCPEFQAHGVNPGFRCAHIVAVLPQCYGLGRENGEERRAMREEGRSVALASAAHQIPPNTLMLLKRSVSPDGRIDSLSVEFSVPLNGETAPDIVERAAKILMLQGQIAKRFLRPPGPANREGQRRDPDGAIPAKLLSIGGMDGKWGRRLFIVVQLEGQAARIFGSEKQLSEHIKAAGYPDLASGVVEGARLMVTCRVIIRPGRDPRYVEIERVLPSEGQRQQGLRRA